MEFPPIDFYYISSLYMTQWHHLKFVVITVGDDNNYY